MLSWDKKKNPQIFRFIPQPYGSGKNKMINLLLPKLKGNIFIFMDGNKFLEKDAIKKITEPFEDPRIGCAGGRPISMNNKETMFGFWASVLTNAAHKLREKRFHEGKFVEQTANLLAVRKGIINEIPNDVAEDSIIPYMIIQKGYKNVYVGDARVLVTYPRNFKDWIKQKVRGAKAHEGFNKYVSSKGIKQKSFLNEVIYGTIFIFSSFKTVREFYWTLLLYPARLYVWIKAFYEIKIKKNPYNPDWSRSESTKILDNPIK